MHLFVETSFMLDKMHYCIEIRNDTTGEVISRENVSETVLSLLLGAGITPLEAVGRVFEVGWD